MEEERETDDDDKTVKDEGHEEDSEVAKANEGLYGDEAAQHGLPSQLLRRSGDSLRVVFPSEPIMCNCKSHLEKSFVERVFHIPAKSLFHLMFGDSTPIWKKVYRARRIGDLEISPWKSANKTLVREYKYTIEFADTGSRVLSVNLTNLQESKTKVTSQNIRPLSNATNSCMRLYYLANDRCYVVLVQYRPWDLPRNESIALLHKYCITYESKTKCKLLVSVSVDLIKVPRIVRGNAPFFQPNV